MKTQSCKGCKKLRRVRSYPTFKLENWWGGVIWVILLILEHLKLRLHQLSTFMWDKNLDNCFLMICMICFCINIQISASIQSQLLVPFPYINPYAIVVEELRDLKVKIKHLVDRIYLFQCFTMGYTRFIFYEKEW